MAIRQKTTLFGNMPTWGIIIILLNVFGAGIFILLGLIFIGVGLWSYHDTNRFVQTAQPAQGTVVELVRSARNEGSSRALCPVIEFTDHYGDSNTFQLNACSYPPRYRRGEIVEVLYASDNPHHAKLKDKSLHLISYIFSGIGALSTVIGFSVLIAFFFIRKWLLRKTSQAADT